MKYEIKGFDGKLIIDECLMTGECFITIEKNCSKDRITINLSNENKIKLANIIKNFYYIKVDKKVK